MRSIALLCSCIVAASTRGGENPVSPAVVADVVFVNGKFWTVDPNHSEAQALAVWHERILALGTNEEMRKLAGPRPKIIDLHGRRAVPGFYDSHLHLLGGGMLLSQVNLK